MAVIIGSARIDENGRAYGGRAGDQTGREVSTQNWYLHSKGWRVFRAKSAGVREKIAKAMRAACDNSAVGYNQYERNSLYKQAEKVGFDISKVKTKCATDCSALVRVCCAYAGITGLPSDFRTGNMPANLLGTGKIVEMKGDKYTRQSAYLRRGDILVTKTSGHTVVVLTDGPKAAEDQPWKLGDRDLKKGCEGDDVRALQAALLAQGYSLPKYGADGDFGSETAAAVKAWQKDHGLKQTGTLTAADCLIVAGATPRTECEVMGALVNIRSAPSLSGRILGTVMRGDRLPFQGEVRKDNRGVEWLLVVYKNENAWISGQYARVG